jgi:hypothetical protein
MRGQHVQSCSSSCGSSAGLLLRPKRSLLADHSWNSRQPLLWSLMAPQLLSTAATAQHSGQPGRHCSTQAVPLAWITWRCSNLLCSSTSS